MDEKSSMDKKNRYIFGVTLVASVGGFLFGFDLAVIAGALPFLETEFHLSPAMKGAAASSAIPGAIVGPLFGLWFADRLGRRKTMMIAAFLFFASTIGTATAEGIWNFNVWRFVGGLGIGLAMMSSPIYIAELSPPHKRGALVNVNQLSNVIGINLAVIVGYFFSFDGWGWRWMFAAQAVPVLFLTVGLMLIPESPRWLASKGRREEALAILKKVNVAKIAEQELSNIQKALGTATGSFSELLQPGMRKALFVGIVMMVFSQINGVNVILLYAPSILAEAGVSVGSNAILSSIPVYVFIFICTVAAFGLIKRFSRRGLLIASVCGMCAAHLLMAFILHGNWSPMATLVPMLLGAGSFTLGLAPLSWVIISEIYPNHIRGKALAVVCFFLYLSSFITAQLFPMLTDWFTRQYNDPAGVYILFALICAACVVFSWKMIPETKGLSLEDIDSLWADKSVDKARHSNAFIKTE
ncbi:MAG: sugar porter family MFS transporter [Chitinophagaceae bacterium]|nr:sugar porter family MFS transporter [Chitinophagaceae bacterium]